MCIRDSNNTASAAIESKYGITFVTTAKSTNTLNCLFNDGLIVIKESKVCNAVMVTIPTIGASLLVTFLKNAGKSVSYTHLKGAFTLLSAPSAIANAHARVRFSD